MATDVFISEKEPHVSSCIANSVGVPLSFEEEDYVYFKFSRAIELLPE